MNENLIVIYGFHLITPLVMPYALLADVSFCLPWSSYHDLQKMVPTSRTYPSQVLLSLLTLAVLHMNIKIIVMWFQLVITVLLKLSWVISLIYLTFSPNFYLSFSLLFIDLNLVFYRSWMELSLWYVECRLHSCWTVLRKWEPLYLFIIYFVLLGYVW